MRRVLLALAAAFTFVSTAWADVLRLDGDMVQGGLVRGWTQPDARVVFDDVAVRVAADGAFVFGFGRDFAPMAELTVTLPDGKVVRRQLEVKRRQYDIQRIDGLPPKMVTPSAEALQRIRRENAWIAEVRRRDTPATWFQTGFVWPTQGRITGVFGSQRVLNGEPRRPHFGIDIAAPTGTDVTAPADGEIALANDDLYFTGGTVMIDHGHGLTSVYSHLSRIDVAVGDKVRQGDRIGAVGSTGRSTGAHLDWRVNWFKQRLDPALLAGPMLGASTTKN